MAEKFRDKILDIFFETYEYLAIFGLGAFFGIGALSIEPKVSWFAMGFIYGAFLAFAALPVFDSDKWAAKPLICAVLGALLSIAWAWFLGWAIVNMVLAGISVLVLGYFAPAWAKYL